MDSLSVRYRKANIRIAAKKHLQNVAIAQRLIFEMDRYLEPTDEDILEVKRLQERLNKLGDEIQRQAKELGIDVLIP